MKHKIITIFGTRPEAIKMAPVIKEIVKDAYLKNVIVATGQHKEMLEDVLNLFNIKPDYNLNVMVEKQSLSLLSKNLLEKLDKIIKEENPELVIVHGDTTTTLMGALASFYHKIPVAHVEAGLRTYSKYSPFPEEINRKVVDSISDLLFAPTKKAKENLISEGINEEKIFITGNTIIDALFMTEPLLKKPAVFKDVKLNQKIITITAHRRENWDGGIENLSRAIEILSSKFFDVSFVFPVHLNPVVRETVFRILKNKSNVYLIEPLPYFEFLYLIKNSYLILSDSGGIQEEASALKKPMFLLREITERPEALESNTVKLVGTDYQDIIKNFIEIMEDNKIYDKMTNGTNPFGDGKASIYILNEIKKYLKIV